MPGRGNDKEYIKEAAKQSKNIVGEYFSEYSDEVKAAVVSGVLQMYSKNIVPSYILETEENY